MTHSTRFLLGCLGLLFVWKTAAQPRFVFDPIPLRTVAGTPFSQRVTAWRDDGSADMQFSGRLDFHAYHRQPPDLVISEIAEDGESIEITNPGREPVSLEGWELEALAQNITVVPAVRQTIPAWILAPGEVFVWSSLPRERPSFRWLVAPLPLNPRGSPALGFQLRSPSGRVVDQVALADSLAFGGERLWTGAGQGYCLGTGGDRIRRGSENHFALDDWRRGVGGFGELNPDLVLPWLGKRKPVRVQPERIQMTAGAWSGEVILEEAGPSASLAVNEPGGPLIESAVFPVLEVAPDPVTGELPQLQLELTSDAATGILSERTPGVHSVMVSANVVPDTGLRVILSSDSPDEIATPAEALIPGGLPLSAIITVTNLDDSIFDGRAAVNLTATTEGYRSARLTLYNDDDETGRFFLQVPGTGIEDSGFQSELGFILLERPTVHAVQALLSAEPPLEVPPAVTIPAGASSASFPIRIGGDFLANVPARTPRITVSLASGAVAEAALLITDDERQRILVDWPKNLVEGAESQGRVTLQVPRDHDGQLTFSSDNQRFPAPLPVTFPAGVQSMTFSWRPPDNTVTDGPFGAMICVALDGNGIACERFDVADDEVTPLDHLEFYPPEAVFSGQSFSLQAFALAANNVPQQTNFSGFLSLSVSPELASVRSGSNPLSFSNSIFHGEVTLDGVALGLPLDLEAAGLNQRSRPLDLIPGFFKSGSFRDIAGIPSQGRLLVSVGAEADVEGLLRELDAQTGEVIRELPLRRLAARIAVSKDGSVAWLASAQAMLQRVDLRAWRVTDEFPVDRASSESSVLALAVLPGGTERVVALVDSAWSQVQAVAYDGGRRLMSAPAVNAGLSLNDIQPGRSSEEAFAGTFQELLRLRVTAEGVEILSQGPGMGDFTRYPNFEVQGDTLLLGDGRIVSADTLEAVGQFGENASWWLASVVPFPEAGRVGFVDTQNRWQVFDQSTRSVVGSHALPTTPDAPSAAPGRIVRCGPRRIAHLLNQGNFLRVWESPLLTDDAADLRIGVTSPEQVSFSADSSFLFVPPWMRTILVTNAGPATAYGVEVLTDHEGSIRVGTLRAGERFLIEREHGWSAEPGVLRETFRVSSGTRDPDASNNSVELETRIVSATREDARILGLAARHLIASPDGNRLYVALERRPGSGLPGVAVIHPESGAVEALFDVGGEPRKLAFSAAGDLLLALTASNRIARWNLAAGRLEIPLEVGDLEILDFLDVPGPDGGLVVATRTAVQIYDGVTLRASMATARFDQRYLGLVGTRLWVARPGELRSYQITATGFAEVGSPVQLNLPSNLYKFSTDARRLYFPGAIYDTAERTFLATLPDNSFLPDSPHNLVYGVFNFGLRRYRQETLEFDAEEALPAVPWRYTDDVVRWGTDGFAMRTASQVLVYRSSLIPEGNAADLALSFSATSPVRPLQPFTLNLTVTNRGTDVARRVRVRVENPGAPADLALTSPEATQFGGAWYLDVDELPVGGSTQMALHGSYHSGPLYFSGRVSAGAMDSRPVDNSAETFIEVSPSFADLAILSMNVPAHALAGEEFEAELVVTNQGPDEVRGVEVDLSKRPDLALISVTGGTVSTECCSGAFVIHSPQTLLPGATARFEMRLATARSGVLDLTAFATGVLNDPDYLNSQQSRLVLVKDEKSGEVAVTQAGLLTWSDARQQFAALVEGRLVLVSKKLTLDRVLPVPVGARFLIFSFDGRYLWIAYDANRVLRLNLESDLVDLDFTIFESVFPFGGMMAVVPGLPDVLVAAGPGAGRPRVTVYDRSVPRPLYYDNLNWFGNGVAVAVSPDRHAYVSTGSELRELEIGPDGVIESRNLDAAAGYAYSGFKLAGSILYFGNGQDADLVSGTRIESGIPFVDPAIQIGYIMRTDLPMLQPVLAITAARLPTGQPLWQQLLPFPSGGVPNLVPMGTNGVVAILDPLQIIAAPDPASRAANLAVAATLSEEVLGTNQFLSLNVTVTNRSVWSAAGAVLEVTLSSGVQATDLRPSPLRFELGTLIGGTNFVLDLQTTAEGPQSVRISAFCELPDSAPDDNATEIAWTTPAPPFLLLPDQALRESVGSTLGLGIQASLSSPAPAILEVSFNVELLTAQAPDLNGPLNGPRVAFVFAKGSQRSSMYLIGDDSLPEGDETFRLVFHSGPVRPARPSSTITILDDDQPRLRMTVARIPEGNGGLREIRVPVRLSAASSDPVEVNYRLEPGSASAGTDFLVRSGRLRIEPGNLTNYVSVPVIGDDDYEPEETLSVVFDDVAGARLDQITVSLGLVNDDLLPAPVVTLTLPQPQHWSVRFPSAAGARYELQSRTNLSLGSWETAPDSLVGDGREREFLLPVGEGWGPWFRVVAN